MGKGRGFLWIFPALVVTTAGAALLSAQPRPLARAIGMGLLAGLVIVAGTFVWAMLVRPKLAIRRENDRLRRRVAELKSSHPPAA